MDDTSSTLQELLKVTSKLVGQVESIDKRMDKIESVVMNDVRQDERLSSIELSLKRGNDKFQALEDRINALEDADGNKAKGVLKTTGSYILTTLLSFITAAVIFYISRSTK